MRAIVIREVGGPDVMRLEELDASDPGPGQVSVRLEAVGVNFIDIYERKGAYGVDLPFVPGREAAGIVDGVGADVTGVEPGDRVAFAMQRGAYAERSVVRASDLVGVPDGIDLDVAAAVMLQGMTAHYLSHDTFPLGQAHWALIHAAAGGVGLLLVQMAKRAGAVVIGTVSTAEKEALARAAGADHVIRYTEADFLTEVRRITEDVGVDVVYDSVGRDTFTRSLGCLRRRGTLALYGQSSGQVDPVGPQVLASHGSLFLTRPRLGDYVANRAELERRAADLFDWIEAGELDVRVDRGFALAEAAAAHRYMEERRTKGKILLRP